MRFPCRRSLATNENKSQSLLKIKFEYKRLPIFKNTARVIKLSDSKWKEAVYSLMPPDRNTICYNAKILKYLTEREQTRRMHVSPRKLHRLMKRNLIPLDILTKELLIHYYACRRNEEALNLFASEKQPLQGMFNSILLYYAVTKDASAIVETLEHMKEVQKKHKIYLKKKEDCQQQEEALEGLRAQGLKISAKIQLDQAVNVKVIPLAACVAIAELTGLTSCAKYSKAISVWKDLSEIKHKNLPFQPRATPEQTAQLEHLRKNSIPYITLLGQTNQLDKMMEAFVTIAEDANTKSNELQAAGKVVGKYFLEWAKKLSPLAFISRDISVQRRMTEAQLFSLISDYCDGIPTDMEEILKKIKWFNVNKQLFGYRTIVMLKKHLEKVGDENSLKLLESAMGPENFAAVLSTRTF